MLERLITAGDDIKVPYYSVCLLLLKDIKAKDEKINEAAAHYEKIIEGKLFSKNSNPKLSSSLAHVRDLKAQRAAMEEEIERLKTEVIAKLEEKLEEERQQHIEMVNFTSRRGK